MDVRAYIARNLSAALLAGVWNRRALLRRTEALLGRSTRKSQRRLIDALMGRITGNGPPSHEWLVEFLLDATWFDRASGPVQRNPQCLALVLEPPKFSPIATFRDAAVPQLATTGDLADWLDVARRQLDWFAGHMDRRDPGDMPALQHYRYAFVPKARGAPRLIEAPKPRLKSIQRKILTEILNEVPPHECAHGFVAGRSCLTSASVHAGEEIVLSIDLKNFFPATRLSRVHWIFRSLGYPSAVSRYLTALCSTVTPLSVFRQPHGSARHDWSTRKAYQTPHLPQGAPTSPALANLAAWRMDCRLLGLAKSCGANYTRYADDLTFSGDRDFAGRLERFASLIAGIASDEGWPLNKRKTRIMRRDACQRVTGIVVNDHVNVPRRTFDRLKATLHNAVRTGPAGQNRDGRKDFRAHLEGRVAWVEHVNPQKGARLRRIFDEIQW